MQYEPFTTWDGLGVWSSLGCGDRQSQQCATMRNNIPMAEWRSNWYWHGVATLRIARQDSPSPFSPLCVFGALDRWHGCNDRALKTM